MDLETVNYKRRKAGLRPLTRTQATAAIPREVPQGFDINTFLIGYMLASTSGSEPSYSRGDDTVSSDSAPLPSQDSNPTSYDSSAPSYDSISSGGGD